MTTLEEIQVAIQSLCPKEVAYLKQWISELDWDNWDREIEAVANAPYKISDRTSEFYQRSTAQTGYGSEDRSRL